MDLGSSPTFRRSLQVPFLHFFDGFRTSSEVRKSVLDYEELAKLVDYEAVKRFKTTPEPGHPKTMGTAQNPDIFFQAKRLQQITMPSGHSCQIHG